MKKEILRYDNVYGLQEGKTRISGLFLTAFAGEVGGVMVNNMREKDFLVSLLKGELKVARGNVYHEENRVTMEGASEYIQTQIGFVTDEDAIYHGLSVADNIYIPRRNVGWFEWTKKIFAGVEELLYGFGLTFDPNAQMYELNEAECKIVELLRAWVSDYRLIVISDIELILSDTQLIEFFRVVDVMKKRGIAFLFLTNSSTNIIRYADRITIIKEGGTISSMVREQFTRSQIYSTLFGRSKEKGMLENTELTPVQKEENAISFVNLKLYGLSAFTITLKRGEVLNVLDYDRNDFHKFLDMLQGKYDPIRGYALVNGKRLIPGSVEEAIHEGIGFVEAKPLEEMLFMDMTVMENLVLMFVWHRGRVFVKDGYKKMIRNMFAEDFTEEEFESKVYAVTIQCRIKLLYYRWILVKPNVLVCVRPFASIEFPMRQLTVDILQRIKKEGIAVLILTVQHAEAMTMEGQAVAFRDGVVISLNEDKTWIDEMKKAR